jgi:hypothetical protein
MFRLSDRIVQLYLLFYIGISGVLFVQIQKITQNGYSKTYQTLFVLMAFVAGATLSQKYKGQYKTYKTLAWLAAGSCLLCFVLQVYIIVVFNP